MGRRSIMELLKNHGQTIVQEATQASEIEEIKSEHGHMPFEGDGLKLNWERTSNSITWTEIRPIYRLNRKDELKLLGGIKYYVDKYMEMEPMWGRAHYHFRGFMTPGGYRKALEEYRRRQEETEKNQTIIFEKETALTEEKEAQRQETIKGLKDQLEKATNPEDISKAVGDARTPERKAYAERIIKTRRARDILSIAAQKAHKEGNEELLHEITEIAKPYAGRYAAMVEKTRRKRLQRRTKSARD